MLKGKNLEGINKGKKIYEIPIIIENSIGDNAYTFKITKNYKKFNNRNYL